MSKPSYAQLEALADFLEGHPQLAAGLLRAVDARRRSKQLWAAAAVRLNAIGGAQRDGKSWSKYWVDKKSYLKRQASLRLTSSRRTGGGSAEVEPPSSQLDVRLLALLGQNYGAGDMDRIELTRPQHSDTTDEVRSPSRGPLMTPSEHGMSPRSQQIREQRVREHRMTPRMLQMSPPTSHDQATAGSSRQVDAVISQPSSPEIDYNFTLEDDSSPRLPITPLPPPAENPAPGVSPDRHEPPPAPRPRPRPNRQPAAGRARINMSMLERERQWVRAMEDKRFDLEKKRLALDEQRAANERESAARLFVLQERRLALEQERLDLDKERETRFRQN